MMTFDNKRTKTTSFHHGFWFALCLLMAGCSGDGRPMSPEEVSPVLGLWLRLGFPDPLELTVTRSNPVKNGITLTDVRVMQFPDNTAQAMKSRLYSEATTGTAGSVVANPSGWFTQDDGGLVTVNTGNDDFTNTDCQFYLVANAGDALSAVTTEDGLKAASLDFTDIAADPAVLTYGPTAYKQETGTTKPVALLAKLRRAYAKVTVNYTSGKGIEISSADIECVPDKIYPFPATPASGSSPAASYLTTGTTIDLSAAATPQFTFYLPENLKGNGTAATEREKNFPAKGPGGTLAGCTCIVLKGTYNYSPDVATSEPISVEYRFYLGSDMVRNYDVERGKHYTLTVNLKGANSADARVNITDGNVFTFDEPDNVNNDVSFN